MIAPPRPVGKRCFATGQAFAPGQRVISELIERDDGSLERRDYLPDAFPGPGDATIGYWETHVPDAARNRRRSTEELFDYFERLHEQEQPADDRLVFVLALLLLQKKRLVLDTEVSEDGEFMTLVGSQGEGPYRIRCVELSDEEIEELQRTVLAVIDAESEDPSAAEA
ncbi:MAG: hypothetical protein D6725_03365 [Planctomycetota bacterium]|nr:MAG: hypothetical protein D6725_03365 [Planctomycetota bacterium]